MQEAEHVAVHALFAVVRVLDALSEFVHQALMVVSQVFFFLVVFLIRVFCRGFLGVGRGVGLGRCQGREGPAKGPSLI